jgi:hypothetical protein
VLPAIGEEGTFLEIILWMGIQILLPLLIGILLARRRRYVLWIMALYGVFFLLFGFGMFGWALMGEGTPVSVYAVCSLFFIIGFGVIFRTMKDLGIGQKPRQFGLDE